KAGISANYMYQWKKRNPSPKALASVADVLNVSVDYLLGKTDDNSTSMKPKQVDITDDDYIMTYQGKPIPPEDMEYIKRILNGGKD
ncbi:helix-turn-helix domain-containing protein, partial [Lacticaseibacillus paracasei]